MTPKILLIYDTRTGNTRKLAETVAEGIREIPDVTAELKMTEEVTPEEAAAADGYAIGSPSHFSIMSGRILTLLTDLYSVRSQMAGKPMAVLTTGKGGQVDALGNIERVIGAFNPEWIKPGMAIEGELQGAEREQALKLGRRLGRAVTKKPV